MTVAAFILGIAGTVLAALSLGWQVLSFRLQGPRPKVSPVVGLYYGGGLLANDATRDARPFLRAIAEQLPPDVGQLVVGINVVNTGRAPLHVAGWALRSEPMGALYLPGDGPIGCPAIPCDVPPGAEQNFFTTVDSIRGLASIAEAVDGDRQRLIATVTSGGRTYVSEPIFTPMLTEDTP